MPIIQHRMTAAYAKALFTIISLVVIAAVLLTMRQQRFEAMHEMAQLHRRMNVDRHALWNLQTDISRHLEPDTLRAAMARARLTVEPLRPRSAHPTGLPLETVAQGMQP